MGEYFGGFGLGLFACLLAASGAACAPPNVRPPGIGYFVWVAALTAVCLPKITHYDLGWRAVLGCFTLAVVILIAWIKDGGLERFARTGQRTRTPARLQPYTPRTRVWRQRRSRGRRGRTVGDVQGRDGQPRLPGL